jgi:signal transduction histidine kinase
MSGNYGAILLVDDDPYVLESTSLLLESYGYSVIPCGSAEDAIAKMKEKTVDAVLSDIKMPGVSGIELLEMIHETESEMPVILMTAYADMETAIDAIKKGAFDFIIKPYKADHLVHSIEKALNYHRLLKMEDDYRQTLEEFNREMETLVAERTMSLMALTVADKIRNPAAVIAWTSKRIIEKEKLSGSLMEGIKDINAEAEKLEKIVGDFQAILKSRHSMFRYEDINGIVRGVMEVVEQEAAHKGIKLLVNLPEQPMKINAQKNLLRVAIFHLMRNAIEATPAGGSVTVASSADKDNIFISIADTGYGISQEDIVKIFDPFFSTKGQRFGMGLPLVKQIVLEHMGEITVESEPAKGASFKMIFPVRWQEKQS